jgi:hypothetical protein
MTTISKDQTVRYQWCSRVSFRGVTRGLEPDAGKLSCPVVRGPGGSNPPRLPGTSLKRRRWLEPGSLARLADSLDSTEFGLHGFDNHSNHRLF